MASRLRTQQNLQYLDDYLDQPIPELSFEEKERATKSAAWHTDKSLAIEVVKWDDFDETIDEWRSRLLEKLQEDASLLVKQDITCVCPSSKGKDSVLCGNELSVQGRFIQHAAKPVQDLLCLYGIDCQISDFNILRTLAPKYAPAVVLTANQASSMPGSDTVTQASSPARSRRLSFLLNGGSEAKAKDRAQAEDETVRLIPDIIVCKNEGLLALLVGELKTPWKHDLEELAVLFEDETKRISIQNKARRWLAQIVQYMRNHELQYGFLTTYEATVFLQLQQRGSNWVVKCSPVVMYNGKESSVGPDGSVTRGLSKHGLRAALSPLIYHCWHDKNHEVANIRTAILITKPAPKPTRSKFVSSLRKASGVGRQ